MGKMYRLPAIDYSNVDSVEWFRHSTSWLNISEEDLIKDIVTKPMKIPVYKDEDLVEERKLVTVEHFDKAFKSHRDTSDFVLYAKPVASYSSDFHIECYQWMKNGEAPSDLYCRPLSVVWIEDYLILYQVLSMPKAFKGTNLVIEGEQVKEQKQKHEKNQWLVDINITLEQWLWSAAKVLTCPPFLFTSHFILVEKEEEEKVTCRRCEDGKEVAVPRPVMKKFREWRKEESKQLYIPIPLP